MASWRAWIFKTLFANAQEPPATAPPFLPLSTTIFPFSTPGGIQLQIERERKNDQLTGTLFLVNRSGVKKRVWNREFPDYLDIWVIDVTNEFVYIGSHFREIRRRHSGRINLSGDLAQYEYSDEAAETWKKAGVTLYPESVIENESVADKVMLFSYAAQSLQHLFFPLFSTK